MATKGKITYKQFVTKYNAAKTDEDKKVFCQSHIVKTYVDYQTKLTEVQIIAKQGNYSLDADVNGKRLFKRSSPTMYFLLKMRLIEDYTDIEIGDNVLDIFNALDEIGALDCLISSIPENEIIKWNAMLDMVNDDIYINERDIVSYLETKTEAVSMVLDTMLSGLGEVAQKLELTQNED